MTAGLGEPPYRRSGQLRRLQPRVLRDQLLGPDRREMHGQFHVLALAIDLADGADAELRVPHLLAWLRTAAVARVILVVVLVGRRRYGGFLARGTMRWTAYARQRATGVFAGYTEVFWNPHQPEILHHGGTGVFPEHRNRGLGRWLKAIMLETMLRELPQAQFVRTTIGL